MIGREGVTKDLLAQEIYQISGRWTRELLPPFWKRQVVVGALESMGQDGGQE